MPGQSLIKVSGAITILSLALVADWIVVGCRIRTLLVRIFRTKLSVPRSNEAEAHETNYLGSRQRDRKTFWQQKSFRKKVSAFFLFRFFIVPTPFESVLLTAVAFI